MEMFYSVSQQKNKFDLFTIPVYPELAGRLHPPDLLFSLLLPLACSPVDLLHLQTKLQYQINKLNAFIDFSQT